MPSGEKVRICCKPTDTFLEIKKALWAAEALREDMSPFILRLRNAETFYQDKQLFRELLGHFLLFREESFHDTLEAVLIDKRDIGDSEKRKTKIPTLTGLNRAQGFLKKKGSGATHKWQERYFVLQVPHSQSHPNTRTCRITPYFILVRTKTMIEDYQQARPSRWGRVLRRWSPKGDPITRKTSPGLL